MNFGEEGVTARDLHSGQLFYLRCRVCGPESLIFNAVLICKFMGTLGAPLHEDL